MLLCIVAQFFCTLLLDWFTVNLSSKGYFYVRIRVKFHNKVTINMYEKEKSVWFTN